MTEQPFGNGRFASATEALDEAETMTSAEHAQLAIAAQMAGMDLDDFIAALAVENGAG